MGEKTAIGYPTRLSYNTPAITQNFGHVKKRAGAPVGMFCIEEDRRDAFSWAAWFTTPCGSPEKWHAQTQRSIFPS